MRSFLSRLGRDRRNGGWRRKGSPLPPAASSACGGSPSATREAWDPRALPLAGFGAEPRLTSPTRACPVSLTQRARTASGRPRSGRLSRVEGERGPLWGKDEALAVDTPRLGTLTGKQATDSNRKWDTARAPTSTPRRRKDNATRRRSPKREPRSLRDDEGARKQRPRRQGKAEARTEGARRVRSAGRAGEVPAGDWTGRAGPGGRRHTPREPPWGGWERRQQVRWVGRGSEEVRQCSIPRKRGPLEAVIRCYLGPQRRSRPWLPASARRALGAG